MVDIIRLKITVCLPVLKYWKHVSNTWILNINSHYHNLYHFDFHCPECQIPEQYHLDQNPHLIRPLVGHAILLLVSLLRAHGSEQFAARHDVHRLLVLISMTTMPGRYNCP